MKEEDKLKAGEGGLRVGEGCGAWSLRKFEIQVRASGGLDSAGPPSAQVHFDEGKAVYLKLDLLVDDVLALRCLEEFSATAASSLGPQLRLCQVSGLLPLRQGSSLRIRTLPWAHLKAAPFLTYFGLFQVH